MTSENPGETTVRPLVERARQNGAHTLSAGVASLHLSTTTTYELISIP
jgi:hypothetical protein